MQQTPPASWFDRGDLTRLFARVRAPVTTRAAAAPEAVPEPEPTMPTPATVVPAIEPGGVTFPGQPPGPAPAPVAVRPTIPPIPTLHAPPPYVHAPPPPLPPPDPVSMPDRPTIVMTPPAPEIPPAPIDGGALRADALVRLTRLAADRSAPADDLFAELARTAALELRAHESSFWRADERGGLTRLSSYDRIRGEYGVAGAGDLLRPETASRLIAALHAGERVAASGDDPRARDYLAGHGRGATTLVAIPLQVDGVLQAAMLLAYDSPPTWSPGDKELVETLGDLALLAFEQDRNRRLARSFAESDQRVLRQTQALARMSKSEALGEGDLYTALREITAITADTLDVARCSVWLYNADKTAILCMDLYSKATDAHEMGVELGQTAFPTYFDALKEERFIAAHDAHTDPRTACFSEPYLTPLGINSMLDAPIRVGGRMIGVVCNEHVGPPRHWTQDEQTFSGSVADCVSLAIESSDRRQAEFRLRQVLSELNLDRK